MSLNNEIIALLKPEGCNIVGFADLRCLQDKARQSFDYGILIALSFTKEAMRDNKNGSPQRYSAEHDPMTRRLTAFKKLIADVLTGKGYEASTNTPASIVNGDTLRSLLPLKTVATLAGIGWIGKCALLVTHEVGSALRMSAVLTNAPLECGTPVTKSLCDPNCKVCMNICPGKAPLGGLWESGVDRDSFFDAHACDRASSERTRAMLGLDKHRCGLCISNCPFTKRALGYE